MNPSGDFGKKELSPALRNRMTEVWVESYFTQDCLLELYSDPISSLQIKQAISPDVDLYKIINESCVDKFTKSLSVTQINQLSVAIFNSIGFVNFVLGRENFALSRKVLSIRDILTVIDFISSTLSIMNGDPILAFRHAIRLVIIDGICLGVDLGTAKQKEHILVSCYKFADQIETEVLQRKEIISDDAVFVDEPTRIGVLPFLLDKIDSEMVEVSQQHIYAFDANTTKMNLQKLLRAYQLNKPILIEGAPGVGKTSLVECLAKATNRKLIRVNLSEQTDMMDLLGSEYPIANKKHSEDENEIRFEWCDGVLLQAIKDGHWFLIDEMNLAQQSVLEGLNAILDHRRTVFIPELGKEFTCHPDFFIFAC
jgi:midasin